MSSYVPDLQSDRLVLRSLHESDTDFVIALLNSPGWIEFIGNRNITTREEALDFLRKKVFSLYEQYQLGPYAVSLKDHDTVMGFCGLFKRDFLDYPDIGYAFLPEHHGKGYAYESCITVIRHEYGLKRFEVIKAITLEKNERSVNLLGKLGFGYERNITYPDSGEELQMYSLDMIKKYHG